MPNTVCMALSHAYMDTYEQPARSMVCGKSGESGMSGMRGQNSRRRAASDGGVVLLRGADAGAVGSPHPAVVMSQRKDVATAGDMAENVLS